MVDVAPEKSFPESNGKHRPKTRNKTMLRGKLRFFVSRISLPLCASQSQPRASPPPLPCKPLGIPWVFNFFFSNARPCGKFLLEIAPPPFLLWCSNARPSSPSDQYKKLLVFFLIKHNCFSSIELHKTGREMSHSD